MGNKKTYTKFMVYLVENKIKHKDVAKILNLDSSAFSKKINRKNNSDFSLNEVRKICDEYHLNPNEYFFID